MNNTYTVGQVNRYIRNMFGQDYFLRRIQVAGEVSNCKYHSSGHIYFSLKDETGVLSCVMFAGQRKGLGFSMKDGDRVVVSGSVEVYERDGRYQLYARQIVLEGAGALYERFLALKNELEEMGMFDPAYKQPIPRMIRRLGIVTAPTGKAIQDIRTVALRRNPGLQLILYPAQVQGEGAARSIARGLRILDKAGVDVIITGRGGGSLEDLWAFNEEEVARAIFECRTPVISAVGHEPDVTISDFVADLRAPTPSAAAELAVDDISQILQRQRQYRGRLDNAMESRLRLARSRLDRLSSSFRLLSPASRLRENRQHLLRLQESLQAHMEDKLERSVRTRDRLREAVYAGMEKKRTRYRHDLALWAERLEGLSPLRKLKQGFAYVSGPDGHTLTGISQVEKEDPLDVYLIDGVVHAVVRETEPMTVSQGTVHR